MQSVAEHAAAISQAFPGFDSGITTIRRTKVPSRLVILTVFNRVVKDDPGLRFKILVPEHAIEQSSSGSVNLLSREWEDEIVINKKNYKHPFTVSDVCNGMEFDNGTVLASERCYFPQGVLGPALVGLYIMPYYVHEIRVMKNISDDTSNVYNQHLPIFENICGFVHINMLAKKMELVSVHGNISFKNSRAVFKVCFQTSIFQCNSFPPYSCATQFVWYLSTWSPIHCPILTLPILSTHAGCQRRECNSTNYSKLDG
jgi:hypothetical protein